VPPVSHRHVVDHLKINCAIGTRCDRLANAYRRRLILHCAPPDRARAVRQRAAMFVILAAIYPYYVVLRDAALQEGSLHTSCGVHSAPAAGAGTDSSSGEHQLSQNLIFLLRNWVEAHYISKLAVKRSGFQFGLRYTVEFNLGRHFEAG
jgi:hypothetical protein